MVVTTRMSFASGVDMGEEICDSRNADESNPMQYAVSDSEYLPCSGPVHERIISDRKLGDIFKSISYQ